MADYNVVPRAQEIDESRNVVQGGTRVEFQVLTCTVSNMQAINFSELPKAVMFQTRSGANDVEFVWGTNTVAQSAAGGYWTIRAGETISLDCCSTGTYYFRNSAANINALVIGVGLL